MELYKSITEVLGNKTKGMWYSVVLSMEEYLEKFWQFYIPGVMELYKSITEILGNKTKGMVVQCLYCLWKNI